MILCEAAGYDVILVETVGVGQSEVTVRSMTDFFLLVQLAAQGDELQGIKKGVIELADGILVNKCDGNMVERSNLKRAELAGVLNFLARLRPIGSRFATSAPRSRAWAFAPRGRNWRSSAGKQPPTDTSKKNGAESRKRSGSSRCSNAKFCADSTAATAWRRQSPTTRNSSPTPKLPQPPRQKLMSDNG